MKANVARTLVMSAWMPELAPLQGWLRTAAGKRVAGTVDLAVAGVGAVDAGIGAARAINARRPQRVLFVGTAGLYLSRGVSPPPLGHAATVVATRLVLVSTGVLRGDAYAPAPMVDRLDATPDLATALLQSSPMASAGVAACPLAITLKSELGRRIARTTGAGVENLEGFSVGRAAQQAGLPFAAVFGISNYVAPGAHAMWRTHHVAASRAACRVLALWLRAEA
ncbi:MAG TPA: phosphorylase [Polyangia bacterium]|nr:phosphorylase [Polyangia bacterium]